MVTVLAVVVGAGLLASPRPLAGQGVQEDLQKVVDQGAERLSKELAKGIEAALRSEKEGFLKAVSEIIKREAARGAKLEKDLQEAKARITSLEKALAEKDARIAALEGKAEPAKPGTSAFLGLGHLPLPDDVRARVQADGALVTQVLPASPAALAGIQEGDVIVAINDQAVDSASLRSKVQSLEPGAEVQIKIVRGAEKSTVTAKLADQEKFFAAQQAKTASEAKPAAKEPVVLGVTVREENGQLSVENVEDGFTGAVAGLKKGDRLTRLNGQAVDNIDRVAAELKKVHAGDELSLTWARGEETIEARVVGAHGKDGAKLLDSKAEKPAAAKPPEPPKPPEPSKPEPPKPEARKPAFLGLEVVSEAGGLTVAAVVEGSGAAKAGLQPGDVVKKAGGDEIKTIEGLQAVLGKLSQGDTLDVIVVRGGKDHEVKGIVLGGAAAASAPAASGEKAAAPPAEAPKPSPPKPETRNRGVMGLVAKETDAGVIINMVTPDGPGAKAGLQAGDLLAAINGQEVKTFQDMDKILGAVFAGDTVKVTVKRGGESLELELTLGDAGA
jgi:S1-C subfamily serine protease